MISIKAIIIGVIGIFVSMIVITGCTTVNTVTVTALDLSIAYNGNTNGYLGPTSQSLSTQLPSMNGGQEFEETLTLHSSALLFSHSINNIYVTTPGFTIESITPSLPYSFSSGSSMSFTLKLKTPNTNFDGPLTILVTTT